MHRDYEAEERARRAAEDKIDVEEEAMDHVAWNVDRRSRRAAMWLWIGLLPAWLILGRFFALSGIPSFAHSLIVLGGIGFSYLVRSIIAEMIVDVAGKWWPIVAIAPFLVFTFIQH